MNTETYINSKGEVLKIREMNTEHLINALAKTHREIYKAETNDDFCKKSDTIVALDKELLTRNRRFWENKWGVTTNE